MTQSLLSIHFRNTLNRDLAAHPVTHGVPFAPGALKKAQDLAIRLPTGQLAPVQTQTLQTWPGGSIRWLLLDFALPLKKNAKRTSVQLVKAKAPATRKVVTVRENKDRIVVTTPHLTAAISKKAFSLFESYQVNGKEMIAPGSDLLIEEPKGKRYYASNCRKLATRVTVAGPQRTVVEVSGRHTAGDGAELFDFRVRYVFRATEPGVMLSYKFTNREMPETGVTVSSIQAILPTTIGKEATTHLIRQCNTGKHWFSRIVEVPENVEIVASAALNEAARTRYGTAADGLVVLRNLASLGENLGAYPYYLRPGNKRTDVTGGLHQVYPYLAVNGPHGSLLGCFMEMCHNFPKSLRCDRGLVNFDFWPAWAGDLLWRRGMSKEHDLFLSFSDRPRSAKVMEDLYFAHEVKDQLPVHPNLDADYVSSCQVLQLHQWLNNDEEKYLAIEQKLGSAGGSGVTHFSSQRGMMDFGDYINPERTWAHNNEDDSILNGLREYFRLEAPVRLRQALVGARHNSHVDFIAFDPDPLRRGTMPAHCPEHTDGATYPSHMWAYGLLAAYWVSGNPDFLDTAVSVGENMLRWQKADPTLFYADSRECGWPAQAFCALYEQTGDRKWLRAVREIFVRLRRTVNKDGVILTALPHGVGTSVSGYGEFASWRGLYFYYELTGDAEVKAFLIKCLKQIYKYRAGHMVGGWACNDMFPCWALYKLTGDKKILEDNYPFLRFLMDRKENFPWGGNDMHFYLGELDRLGELEKFAK